MKQKTGRKLLSFLVALAVIITPMSGMCITMQAANGVQYISRSWNGTEVVSENMVCTDYNILTPIEGGNRFVLYGAKEYPNETTTSWYVADKTLSLPTRCAVTGTVNLIICDGVTLDCTGGILFTQGSILNLYFQSNETGKLISTATTSNYAGIGGQTGDTGGNLNIYGGNVTATGGTYGAGIGGGEGGNGGTINIYGGNVTARGGGDNGDGGTITIDVGENGRVESTGGKWGAGIGGGEEGNGGVATISGGTVTAQGGYDAAGIGSGEKGKGGVVTISGGTVEATGGDAAAGIGGGYSGYIHQVIIDNGNVTATGGNAAAGIGGPYKGVSGEVIINNGTVNACGGINGGTGIGSGANCKEQSAVTVDITINGGTVNAKSGWLNDYNNHWAGAAIGAGGAFFDNIDGSVVRSYFRAC